MTKKIVNQKNKNANKRKEWKKWRFLFFCGIATLIACVSVVILIQANQSEPLMDLIRAQMECGNRIPQSAGHQAFIRMASSMLRENGWQVTAEETEFKGQRLTNILAERDGARADAPWVLLGAHYDTRIYADSDPDVNARAQPVPGANDGASGVAVLLRLSKIIPQSIDKKITIALFDAEDQGGIPGWPGFCIGSQQLANYYAETNNKPDMVVIVDMIGDKDLNIYREQNSDKRLKDEIWGIAAEKGLQNTFINQEKFRMYDDHVPFIEIGIPAVDLIDFDYPWWHTVADTMDKVSEKSLSDVTDVLLAWLTK